VSLQSALPNEESDGMIIAARRLICKRTLASKPNAKSVPMRVATDRERIDRGRINEAPKKRHD
jgi:hypothetical protein